MRLRIMILDPLAEALGSLRATLFKWNEMQGPADEQIYLADQRQNAIKHSFGMFRGMINWSGSRPASVGSEPKVANENQVNGMTEIVMCVPGRI